LRSGQCAEGLMTAANNFLYVVNRLRGVGEELKGTEGVVVLIVWSRERLHQFKMLVLIGPNVASSVVKSLMSDFCNVRT
jgi:hypothetical protein